MDNRLIRRGLVAGVAGTLMSAKSGSSRGNQQEASDDSYLWAATTWHVLATSSYQRFRDAVVGNENAWTLTQASPQLFAELGVWNALYLDAHSIIPPDEYNALHEYLVLKLGNLATASDYYLQGILEDDMDLVRRGAEFFNQGNMDDQEFHEAGYAKLLVSRSSGTESTESSPPVEQSAIVQSQGEYELAGALDTLEVSTGPTVGSITAKVTMHIFSDYQCSYCKWFYEETFPLIITDFVETAQVKLQIHDFPRMGTDPAIADPGNLLVEITDPNNESALAAHAAMSAGEQLQYLQMSELLFRKQDGVQQGTFSRENLTLIAESLGIDTVEFNQSMDSGRYLQALAHSVHKGQKYGITATPMFILENGIDDPKLIQQVAEGYNHLKPLIELAIENAG